MLRIVRAGCPDNIDDEIYNKMWFPWLKFISIATDMDHTQHKWLNEAGTEERFDNGSLEHNGLSLFFIEYKIDGRRVVEELSDEELSRRVKDGEYDDRWAIEDNRHLWHIAVYIQNKEDEHKQLLDEIVDLCQGKGG